jgi:hypothetical protein
MPFYFKRIFKSIQLLLLNIGMQLVNRRYAGKGSATVVINFRRGFLYGEIIGRYQVVLRPYTSLLYLIHKLGLFRQCKYDQEYTQQHHKKFDVARVLAYDRFLAGSWNGCHLFKDEQN